jgi:hypothetical protein
MESRLLNMKTLRALTAFSLAICGSCNYDSISCPPAGQFVYGEPRDSKLFLWVGDRVKVEATASSWETDGCDDATVIRLSEHPEAFGFTVTDTTIAAISPVGEIIARGAGQAKVTATWTSHTANSVSWDVMITPPVARIATSITPADTAQLNQTVKVVAEAQDAAGNPIPEAPLSLVSIFVSSAITSRYVSPATPYTARSFSFDAIWHGSYAITLTSQHSVGSSVTATPRIYVP